VSSLDLTTEEAQTFLANCRPKAPGLASDVFEMLAAPFRLATAVADRGR
jgi:hypothetical protein